MTRTEHTNAHGIRFYVEGAADFDDSGLFKKGSGWFAGIIVDRRHDLSGVWFETRDQALSAISDYRGAA